MLPALILWKKAKCYFQENCAEEVHNAEEQPGVNSIIVI
jgi:hypothetical protein